MDVVRMHTDDRAGRDVIVPELYVFAQRAAKERHGRVEAQRFLQAALEQLHLVQVPHRRGTVRTAKDRINFLVNLMLNVRMQCEQKQCPAHAGGGRIVSLENSNSTRIKKHAGGSWR